MSKVLIVGSGGTIGKVLKDKLPHETTDFDLPHFDAEEYKHLYQKAQGHDAIVHLAWDFERDGWLAENLNPDNTLISYNVYQAAVDAGVKRVIMASSVHADKFIRRETPGLLRPYDLPLPDSPYGAGKVLMESLGRYYADAKGLEVICIRFGGVNKQDVPPETPPTERQVWLSHRDCAALVQACIDAPTIPDNYAIVYAVSNNTGRLHDTSNPFGWQAQDGAA
ncbi:MAG TPA: NAD(P)-dependent oxidoreductase [Candidatus Saccharimonadales bacterium]|nr:NAD(P)-dependent oxidoreductase [Candidatus Saccharimonadales bacterium]